MEKLNNTQLLLIAVTGLFLINLGIILIANQRLVERIDWLTKSAFECE